MLRSFLPVLLTVVVLSQFTSAKGQVQPSTPTAASVESEPSWKVPLDAHIKELSDQNGPGTDAALRERLSTMLATDQSARRAAITPSTAGKESMQKLAATDTELTAELKQIVEKNGWPTIALVGIDASNAAMTILTHTPDHAWQLQLLPQLEELADAGKIQPSGLASVVDKELVSEGKLQRYGSQFQFFNGELAMYAVENPGELDTRRAKALLPPIAVYKQTMTQLYHLKVSDNVVMAVKPQTK